MLCVSFLMAVILWQAIEWSRGVLLKSSKYLRKIIDRLRISHCFSSNKHNYVRFRHLVQWRIIIKTKIQIATIEQFPFLFSAKQKEAQNTFFVTLWFNESINQERPNASKNSVVLMTPCKTSGQKVICQNFFLLCPIQSISYGCNLCGAFTSCGEVFSGES